MHPQATFIPLSRATIPLAIALGRLPVPAVDEED